MFTQSTKPTVSSVSLVPLASLVLSAALCGCREDHVSSVQAELGPPPLPSQARSLAEVPSLSDGGRVYLSNVKLVPIVAGSNTVGIGSAQFEVIDTHGGRMLGILEAPHDSFLWSLAPSTTEGRLYSDFGAIKKNHADGAPTLSIFKLAN
jgi:hypothetical protein